MQKSLLEAGQVYSRDWQLLLLLNHNVVDLLSSSIVVPPAGPPAPNQLQQLLYKLHSSLKEWIDEELVVVVADVVDAMDDDVG